MKATSPASTSPRSPSPKAIVGVGRVVLWTGGSLWIGRDAGKAQAHAHHAIQISVALTDTLRLYNHANNSWNDYAGAIVFPHHRHQFDGRGASVAHLFVEPETTQGRKLLQQYSGMAIAALPQSITARMKELLSAAFTAKVTDVLLIAAGQQSINELSGDDTALSAVDPRITKAIDFVRSRLDSRVTLAEAAATAHLSPGRFRHLFVAQTGISFRGYLQWARIEAAVASAMSGEPWTDAAQRCGFADSAHLSRTCRRIFGIAPTMLARE